MKNRFLKAGIFRFELNGKAYTFLINPEVSLASGAWYTIATTSAFGPKAYSVPVLFEYYIFVSEEEREQKKDFYRTIVRVFKTECPNRFKETQFPISRVWFNDADGSTIVEFNDGDRIDVRALDKNKYDRGSGIAWALLKKVCGSGSELQRKLKELGAISKGGNNYYETIERD